MADLCSLWAGKWKRFIDWKNALPNPAIIVVKQQRNAMITIIAMFSFQNTSLT